MLRPLSWPILILLVLAPFARGQVDPTPAPADAPAAVSSDQVPVGMSLPVSPGVTERFDKARAKETEQQWGVAAQFYQEILNQFAGRVVPVKVDATTDRFEFTGVTREIDARLSKWPADGLVVYRSLFAQPAADALAAAGPHDVAALEKILTRYFATDAAKSAGIRLMDLRLEAGDFRAAQWTGELLLQLYPDLQGDRPMVLFRTAAAAHWGGEETSAVADFQELQLKFPQSKGTIAGEDVVLAEALEKLLKAPAPRPTTQPTDADHWPRYAGPGGRCENQYSGATPGGAALNPITLTPPIGPDIAGPQKAAYDQQEEMDLAAGQSLGIMPAVDGRALFFQDGRHLYAVNADSGQPLPGWAQTYSGDRGGRYGVNIAGRARGEQLTVAVTSDRVLAVMGQVDRNSAVDPGTAPAPTRLVCLDRTTGRELWTRGCDNLPAAAAASLRTGDYNGCPLIVPSDSADGDQVLIIARGDKANQFEDCYVVSLSLKTGDYLWSTYLCSASRMTDTDGGFAPQDTSQLSLAEGRVFALTNLGVVAALNATDGQVLWLNSYPRALNNNAENGPMFMRNRFGADGRPLESKPWTHNPVCINNGRVFILPSDGTCATVYDAGSGTELKRILAADYDSACVLLGVKDRSLYLSTDKGCFCIDWQKYNRQSPDEAILWARKDVAADTMGDENTVFGRGFMTEDSIFLPTRHRICQLSLSKGGKLLAWYPARGSWSGGQGAGNIVVTSQDVIVAGSTRVDVYSDLSLVRKRYEAEIAAAPQEAGPRVRYAEVLFAAGQVESAITRIDEAMGLIGGRGHLISGKDRDLIYFTTMSFAEKAALGGPEVSSAAVVDQLFDRVAAAADTPSEQAVYRLARAKFALDRKNFPQAVQLCQEVLTDPVLRSQSTSDSSTAGEEAEAQINLAIQSDPSSYAAIQQKANQALQAAVAANDPNELLAIAIVYPNSDAVQRAERAAVGLFESSHQFASAIRAEHHLYTTSADTDDRAKLLETIARDSLQLPDGIGVAIDRLSHGIRTPDQPRLSQPLHLPDGTQLEKLSFADAVDRLRQQQEKQAIAQLPDFHLATPAADITRPFAPAIIVGSVNAVALVRPDPGATRNDRLLTWSPAGLCCFVPGESEPRWTQTAITDPPRGAAWINGNLAVWTLLRLSWIGVDGKLAWTMELQSLPGLNVATAGESVSDDLSLADQSAAVNGGPDPRIIVNGQQRIFVGGNARLIVRRGQVRLVQIGPPGDAVPVEPSGNGPIERFASVASAGDELVATTSAGRVIGIHQGDGAINWQIRLSESAISAMQANARFVVVRVDEVADQGAQIVVLDSLTGRLVGRRRFASAANASQPQFQLQNFALSEEGTLAFTVTNALLVKDLYEDWKAPAINLTAKSTPDTYIFTGLNRPDQLMVRDGRVLALYAGGRDAQVYDLAAGAADASKPDENKPLDSGAGSDSATATMQLAGSRLYLSHGTTFTQYDLRDRTDHYAPLAYDVFYPPKIRELLLGRDYAVLVNDPADHGPVGAPLINFLAYRRAAVSPTNPHESGLLDYDPTLKDPAGITAWQGVTGGIYYLTGDQKLHFLAGARQ